MTVWERTKITVMSSLSWSNSSVFLVNFHQWSCKQASCISSSSRTAVLPWTILTRLLRQIYSHISTTRIQSSDNFRKNNENRSTVMRMLLMMCIYWDGWAKIFSSLTWSVYFLLSYQKYTHLAAPVGMYTYTGALPSLMRIPLLATAVHLSVSYFTFICDASTRGGPRSGIWCSQLWSPPPIPGTPGVCSFPIGVLSSCPSAVWVVDLWGGYGRGGASSFCCSCTWVPVVFSLRLCDFSEFGCEQRRWGDVARSACGLAKRRLNGRFGRFDTKVGWCAPL
jgi:hypothetical protein